MPTKLPANTALTLLGLESTYATVMMQRKAESHELRRQSVARIHFVINSWIARNLETRLRVC